MGKCDAQTQGLQSVLDTSFSDITLLHQLREIWSRVEFDSFDSRFDQIRKISKMLPTRKLTSVTTPKE